MADRTINFGSDSTEATYQIQDDDPAGGGDFVIRDTDANLAILSYDQTNDEWDFAATANFNSNSVSGITSLSADSITVDILDAEDINNADSLSTGTFEATNQPSARVFASSSQTLVGLTKVEFDSVDFDDRNDFDTSQHVYVVPIAGTYLVSSTLRLSNLSDGGRLDIFLRLNDTSNISGFRREIGGPDEQSVRHTVIHSFSANDELQIDARQFAGGDAVVETGRQNSFFQIHKLA